MTLEMNNSFAMKSYIFITGFDRKYKIFNFFCLLCYFLTVIDEYLNNYTIDFSIAEHVYFLRDLLYLT